MIPSLWRRARYLVLLALPVFMLTGCESVAYYSQAVGGQFEMLSRAREIDAVLEDPGTSALLRQRLETARQIRAYASARLGLPDNGSYRKYADLGRPYAVWNVFAAREFATTAVESCFPVVGCVNYRGFFSQADAARRAAQMRAMGDDVLVMGIPAYSTLGWFDDPLLSTFIRYPESELARLVFHELAHQVVYVKGDTDFNESFAVAVERAGVRRWLADTGRGADLTAFLAARARHAAFIALIESARVRLSALYAEGVAKPPAIRRAEKRAAFEQLKREYAALKAQWGGFSGYDRIIGDAPNNALLVSITAYSKFVPGFERLLEEVDGDLPRFYAAVRKLAKEPEAERCKALQRGSAIKSAAC